MAASTKQGGKAIRSSDVELLMHPELLSHDFMRLILSEKHVYTGVCESRDRLTELYLQHVIPRPQRTLPDSRWGKRMEEIRGRHTPAGHGPHSSGNNHNRKRPLIVFDGSSSGPLKVKKPAETTLSTGTTDRLKPPPAANLPFPIRKLSGNTSSSSSSSSASILCSTDAANLKREAISLDAMESPEVKKKIQHVTWP
ncbi:ashwin [Pseudoliparis swirei]|uniref:ashwin n=1 Tax=Pseudoliparis swirei TaxID=2059687 RepID=UPI0024BE526B|nr:ashwin [Pseudoliparis swirei]